jgi:hypothetical protein
MCFLPASLVMKGCDSTNFALKSFWIFFATFSPFFLKGEAKERRCAYFIQTITVGMGVAPIRGQKTLRTIPPVGKHSPPLSKIIVLLGKIYVKQRICFVELIFCGLVFC